MCDTDVILTGLPRSGTTLTCHLLNKLPDTIALHEPMQGIDYGDTSDPRAMSQRVKQFFDEQRVSIREHGLALSRNINGVVPDNPFGEERSRKGIRRQLDTKGEIVIDKLLSDQFMLVVKHTNRFAPILKELTEMLPVYALVRNPLATLASWRTVQAGIRKGRSGPAGRVVPQLRERMERIDDELDRQIYLLSWFWEQFRRHLPEQSIIPYEELATTRGQVLKVIRPEAAHLNEEIENRNVNTLYDHQDMMIIGERLLNSSGAYWETYTRESVGRLLDKIERTASKQ